MSINQQVASSDEPDERNDDICIALQKSRQLAALLPLIFKGMDAANDPLAELAAELATDVHFAMRRIS